MSPPKKKKSMLLRIDENPENNLSPVDSRALPVIKVKNENNLGCFGGDKFL